MTKITTEHLARNACGYPFKPTVPMAALDLPAEV
jgi:hypothetical protein